MQLHQIPGHIQSIYLVEYPGGLMLLDGCSRADIGSLRRFITCDLDRPFSDLKLITVTHMHPDHAGGAHKLRQLTGCQIAASAVDGHWYSGLDGVLMHWSDLLLANWVAGRMGKPRRNLWYPRKLNADIQLHDGDAVPGFEEWQAMETQGHTDRDLSLLHVPSNRVYVADLMVKVKGKYIPPFPVFYPNRYRASIAKIRELAPDSLLLAHGGEVQLSGDAYEQLIERSPRVPTTHWRSVKLKFKQAVLGH